MEMRDLPSPLAERPFTYQDAVREGLTKYDLTQLMQNGIIERIARGVYIPEDFDSTEPEGQYLLATVQCGTPSAICLLSALDHYHVTDQIPRQVWMMVPQSKRIQSGTVKLIRARNPKWDVGIDKTNPYWITTLPRTLVECLLYKHRIGSDVAISALKTAVKEKKTTLSDVLKMAGDLGVQHRIVPYIETLAS